MRARGSHQCVVLPTFELLLLFTSSSILPTELKRFLLRYVAPAAIEAGLPSSSVPALLSWVSTVSLSTVPGISDAIIEATGTPIKHAYLMASETVFLSTIPFSVFLLITAILYCPNVENYMIEDVARKLQRVRPKGATTKAEDAGFV